MRSTLTLFLALACTLFVVACWTQFDPPPGPTDDDDTSVVDDDDTSVVDDDDTSVVDDDDTTPADDDDAAPDCDDPVVIGAVVTLTDASGALTNTLTVSDPMTINVSVVNGAGNNGTTGYYYGSPCIFSWSLWYQDSTPSAPHPVSGGPTCPAAVTFQDYTCGAPAVVGTDTVSPIEGVSGNPVVPGNYDLIVDTIHFGIFNFVVTVP
jgi:hypothetical protein